MMSKEELMKPRYKVIAKYPGSFWEIGEVFNYSDHNCFKTESQPSIPMHGSVFTEHPHLFKKLEWWEDRKPEEMPEYVIFTHSSRVYKISKWLKQMGGWHMNNVVDGKGVTNGFASIEWHFQKDKCVPATREEYEQYMNQQTTTNEQSA